MTTYIWKKMVVNRKETVGNILFVSCIVAVLIVCWHVIEKIREMVQNDWYKYSMEVASIQDPFIRDKMGAILWMVMVLVGIVIVFCFVLYALKLKMDIIKERQRISVFQVLGYTSLQRIHALYLGKLAELLPAAVVGSVLAACMWKLLCKQELLVELMTMMDDNLKFQWQSGWLLAILLAVLGYVVIFLVIRKKTNITDMLKGAEHE